MMTQYLRKSGYMVMAAATMRGGGFDDSVDSAPTGSPSLPANTAHSGEKARSPTFWDAVLKGVGGSTLCKCRSACTDEGEQCKLE